MDFHLQCLPEAIFSVTRWRSSAAQSQVDWSGSHRPKQLRLQRARLRSERLRLAERKLSGTIFVTSRGWPCRTGCQKVCQALWHMQGLICGAFRKRAPRRRSTHNNRLNAGWAWLSRVASNPLMAAQAKVTGLLNQCGGMTLLLHLVMLNGSETWKRRQPTYLKRVQGLAGDLGIALGFSSLGVRKPRSSNQGASLKRTWRATGSPCEWNATVLIEELTHAGLQNVKVLSRKSWGKQVEWWAEATAKDHDFFEISTGSLFVVVIATPASKLKRQTVKKLASGERGSCFQIHERQRKKSPELSKRLEGLFTLARLSNRKKCRQRWLTPLLALQKVNLCGGKLATIARKDKVRRLPKTGLQNGRRWCRSLRMDSKPAPTLVLATACLKLWVRDWALIRQSQQEASGLLPSTIWNGMPHVINHGGNKRSLRVRRGHVNLGMFIGYLFDQTGQGWSMGRQHWAWCGWSALW